MKRFIVFIILLCFIFSFVPGKTVQGNSGPIFLSGVNIVPYKENNIALTKETLLINFGKDNSSTTVDAKFVFVNTGDNITLKLGFPFGSVEKSNLSNRVSSKILDAKVKINGVSIKPEFFLSEAFAKEEPWIYFDATFNKNETKTIEVSYNAIPIGGYFLYVLKTGALWKGPIGTLDITMTFPYEASYPNVLTVTPSGYTIHGNKIEYHLKNFEPTSDIEVEFLPYSYYEKIKPFEDKALKINSPNDWFNYALSLFPKNPLGTLDQFVYWYRTSAFKDYVYDVLKNAMNLEKEDSAEYIILKEIQVAHYSYGISFYDGYDGLTKRDIYYPYYPYSYLPSDALNLLKDHLNSIKSPLEGKIFGYLLEYAVFADLRGNYETQAISDFNALLDIANKYFDEDDYKSGSPYLSTEMRIEYPESERLKSISPAFAECFIPSVTIKDNTVFISYELPYSMALSLEDFDVKISADNNKNYSLSADFEKTTPYRYVLNLSFLDNLSEEEFNETKNYIIQSGNSAIPKPTDSHTTQFLSIYFSDILDNLSFKNGKIVPIKSSIDCSSKVNNALKKLNDEVVSIKNCEKNFKSTEFDDTFTATILFCLSLNKAYFDNLSQNPSIKFETANHSLHTISKSCILITILSCIIVLLAIIILLLRRKNRLQNTIN